ncbi:MAG TPA: DNA-processing protein DprA [Abditibacteriaceae bacterium]|jgi:DNA processing protein
MAFIPTSNFEREAWLRLAFVALPASRVEAALARWQTPEALLGAALTGDEQLLQTTGITPNTVERLREAAEKDLTKTFAAMEQKNIRLLLREDADYPAAIKGIPSPPPYLFVRGEILPQDEVAIAIVGTRHATEYGRGVAEKFAAEFAARGVTVVSGLARGIDTAAHRGALDSGGRTFAVCGCGLDIVYPADNRKLMEDVEAGGAALSEFAPTVSPQNWHFPARNRIISGLCAGVVVVEAGERSGALITSDFAMEQGREVFAVPGNIHKVQSRGPHRLIKEGATLVESAADVLEALNNRALPFESDVAKQSARARTERAGPILPRADLSADENRVWVQLETEAQHVDKIAASAQMGAAQVNGTLVLLELKGLARRLPGGLFAKNS